MIGNIRRSPRYIRAANEDELQKKILLLQVQTGREYSFLTVYPIKNGVIAWYYDSTGTADELIRILKK
jgi:hypothetical protein